MTRIAVSTTAILIATAAFAQTPPPPPLPPPGRAFAQQQLATTSGMVGRFTLTPRGDLDGLILGDGTEVHVPPHLSAELAAAVRPGDAVTISGYRSPTVALFIATSVANTANNQTVVDRGRPPPGFAPPPPPPGMPHPGRRAHRRRDACKRCCTGPRATLTAPFSMAAPSCGCHRTWPTRSRHCWCPGRPSPLRAGGSTRPTAESSTCRRSGHRRHSRVNWAWHHFRLRAAACRRVRDLELPESSSRWSDLP